jgi:hypothetical protein
VSVNPPALSDEDKNTFDQAYTMTVLAIIEEIKPPQLQQKEGGPDLQLKSRDHSCPTGVI